MSYDYLMFHRAGPWPQWVKRIAVIASGEMGSMGTPEELMGRVGGLFPQVTWRKMQRAEMKAMLGAIKGAKVDPDAPVWFGGGGPEFQLSADVDGQVKSMTVSRAEPKEIRLLCRRLGLVYMDLQAEGILGMLFR